MSASMAERQEKIHPESTKHWETGSGTINDPEISFLVRPCVENPWKNELTINVAYEAARDCKATKIRIRHIIHNTTRGMTDEGVTMRFKTDWHITVYVWVPELGFWQHGDIFYRRHGRVGCSLMEDERRRDRDGKGIELWEYPEDENRKNSTRAQRNERLAQAIEEGRWCKEVIYKEKKDQLADLVDGVDDGNYEEDEEATPSPDLNGDLEVGGNAYIGGGLTTTGSSQIDGNVHVDLDSRVAGNLKVGQNSFTGGSVVVGSTAKLAKIYPYAWHNPSWGPSMSSTE